MEQALAQAIAGKGNLLLLEGEAGVNQKPVWPMRPCNQPPNQVPR
ncbi:MAG: hypothetical protein U0175_37615 [Caldilineaceae bacterium]